MSRIAPGAKRLYPTAGVGNNNSIRLPSHEEGRLRESINQKKIVSLLFTVWLWSVDALVLVFAATSPLLSFPLHLSRINFRFFKNALDIFVLASIEKDHSRWMNLWLLIVLLVSFWCLSLGILFFEMISRLMLRLLVGFCSIFGNGLKWALYEGEKGVFLGFYF